MGYVFARKEALYIAYRRPDGRWIRESAGTDKRTLAKALLAKKEQEMLKAEVLGLPIQSDLRLEEFMEEYLLHAEASKKPSSLRRDETSLKRLLPTFGRMKLREITPGSVQRYVDTRRLQKRKNGTTARASTICNEMNTLSAIFREAVRRELVSSNPVSRVKRPKEDNTIVRYLTPDEEQRLFAELPERLKPIVTVALNSGMRRGELLKLEWSDVDLEQRLILVRNTKSNRKRYIPMNEVLFETLKSIPRGKDDRHVFVNPTTGDAYEDIKRSWGATLKRAKVEKFRFHDLRHSFASKLVQEGAPIMAVKELLGHRDVSTTQRYAHLSPSDLRQAVDLLNRTKTEKV